MNLCYLAKFGKNKFNLWHMLLGAIAGGAHTGTFESGHLTLVSGAGEGEVVSKKVGKEVRGAQGSRGGPVSRERHRYHTHAGTQGAREQY